MEQNIVIYVGIYKALALIGSLIGSLGYGAWYAGTRLSRVETKVDTFEARLTSLEGRLDGAFSSKSPVALLPRGRRILEGSGLREYINKHKQALRRACESANSMDTPYDIQQSAFRFFSKHDFGLHEPKLKAAAYRHGVTLDAVRRIAAIYFRDLCLAESGYKA